MRIAAGIILIILGVLGLGGLIIPLSAFIINFSFVPVCAVITILGCIVQVAFFITGGILCLRRKYWWLCLALASFAVIIELFGGVGRLLSLIFFTGWINWILLLGAVISIIFISIRRKEWQEILD
jgi:hypothetical protein